MSQPMNALQAFAYNAQPVRIIERDGQPWFVLKDVCRILGIQNPGDVSVRLDDDEKGIDQIYTLGGKQSLMTVSESGLYAVILRSDKPEAKPFRKWVTAEVLPSIRQHGFYEVPSTLKPKRSTAQPPLGKHYYTSSRCTVCNTPHVHRIDQMLSGNVLKQDGKRYGYEDILLWARLKGVTLSKASLSRHRTEHLLPRLNPQGQDVTRGGLDGVLRRVVREVVQDVLGEVLGEVQHHARRATQGRSRRTVQAPQAAEPSEDDLVPPRGQQDRAAASGHTTDLGRREADLLHVLQAPAGSYARGGRVKAMAQQYAVDESTVRDWIKRYEHGGAACWTPKERGDRGAFRLSTETLSIVRATLERYPDFSARAIQERLSAEHPEVMTGRTGARAGKMVSTATIARIKRSLKAIQAAEPSGDDETSLTSQEGGDEA